VRRCGGASKAKQSCVDFPIRYAITCDLLAMRPLLGAPNYPHRFSFQKAGEHLTVVVYEAPETTQFGSQALTGIKFIYCLLDPSSPSPPPPTQSLAVFGFLGFGFLTVMGSSATQVRSTQDLSLSE
jgi:hypothetical protein